MPIVAKTACFIVMCALMPASASAAQQDDYMALITRYVHRLNNIYDGAWAYTWTTHDKRHGEVRVRRIDPGADEPGKRDELLSINGEVPDSRRLAEHIRQVEQRERRHTRAHEDPSRPLERPGLEKQRFLAALIPESIELEAQEGDLLHLRFRAMEQGRENVFSHLDGLLVLDTKLEYIKELRLTPTGPFYPFFLTKVEDAYLSVGFELVNGEPLQTSAVWKLLGQALIVKNLDADMGVEWSDFTRVQPALQLTAADDPARPRSPARDCRRGSPCRISARRR